MKKKQTQVKTLLSLFVKGKTVNKRQANEKLEISNFSATIHRIRHEYGIPVFKTPISSKSNNSRFRTHNFWLDSRDYSTAKSLL